MKILLIIIFCIISNSQGSEYKIDIKLTGAKGKAYLIQQVDDKWIKRDSAELVNGECQFRGSIKNPRAYYLNLNSGRELLPFFIENSEISIIGRSDSLMFAKVSGSLVNKEFQAYQKEENILNNQMRKIIGSVTRSELEKDKGKKDSIMALIQNISKQKADMQQAYVRAQPASYVSVYLLTRVYKGLEVSELDGFLSALDPKLNSHEDVVAMKEHLKKLKVVGVGKTAPDFTLNDVNGKPVRLSSFYAQNRYTLIDFWASWCGPCRQENPGVVAAYKAFKDKGFGIIGISIDTNKEKWLKAIADDKLNWTHVSDLLGTASKIPALYQVTGVPSNFLVDKTGKIVARNLRGEKLGETLSSLMK